MYRTNRNTLAHLAGIRFGRGPVLRNDGTTDGDKQGSGSGTGDAGAGDVGDNAGNAGDDGGKPPVIDGDLDKERAARAIAAAREGEKKAKADAKAAQERVEAILKAAGLAPDGKTDPAEQLKAAREAAEAATASARQIAIELAVYKAAPKAGADPDAMLDSRGFLASLAEADPAAADFSDKVAAGIKAALKNNPKLAASGQGPARQGADHTGGSGKPPRSASLDDAVKRKLGG